MATRNNDKTSQCHVAFKDFIISSTGLCAVLVNLWADWP